jgi:hypothetical protein
MVDNKPVEAAAAPKPSARVETFHEESHDDDEVHLPMHNEVYADVAQAGDPPPAAPVEKGDKTVVTDKAEATALKEADPIDPYERIDRAQRLAQELESIIQQGKKPDDTISVLVGSEIKEVKVSDRVAQLKTEMGKEMESAKKGADAILMKGTATNPGIDDLAKQSGLDRDKLCKELGLDPTKLTPKVLGQEYQKASGDAAKQGKIQELAQLMVDRDALSRLHFAPLTTRLVEAEFRARGYLDPAIKLTDPVPEAEIKKAFEILKGAPKAGSPDDIAAFGDGKEIREAREVFATSEKTVSILFMDQQQKRAEKIAHELNAAKLDGDKESHFKNALKYADTLNVGWLANQAYRDDNMKSGVSEELIDIVRMASNARLKYSEFLVSQGRFHEAQPLMAQVKADSPELIFAKEGDATVYRQHDDGKTYEELDRAVNLGVTVNPANFESAQSLLFDKLGKDKIGTVDDGNKFIQKLKDGTLPNDAAILKHLNSDEATSIECLKMMKLCREQYKKDMAAANQVLDKEVEGLEAKKKTFENRELNKDEEVEKARIERQMASLKLTRDEREVYSKRVDAMTDFTEGLVHLSHGGAKSAHELFASALAKDPSLDAQLAEMKKGNPDLQTISDLAKMTDDTLDGYWKRNYKKFAVAGAAAAGTLTGVGLIGVCGSIGAGVTTTAVVATTGGALTGGGVHWGIHRSVNANAGWPEFRDGAKIGGLSAALVASPWAAQAYRAKLGTDVATTSTIGNLATKIGVTKGTLAGSLAMSYTFEAGNVYFEGKPVGQAAVDGTKEGVFNSIMMGISRNWGLPSEGGAIKQAMLNRYTIGTSVGLGVAPEALSVAIDGKPIDKAAKDAVWNSTQYAFMLGLAKKMHATDPSTITGLGRFGLNRYTFLGGVGLGAAPELKNWALHGKPGDEALRDGSINSLISVGALAGMKRFGLSDYGTGARVAAPTMRDAVNYGWRSFAMQESWNAAISVGMKQIYHGVMREPYYIKDQGSGFVAPITADFFDRYFGKELDPNHFGDRRLINSNLDALNGSFTGSIFAPRNVPDPLVRPTVTPEEQGKKDGKRDDKKGLFRDYSK